MEDLEGVLVILLEPPSETKLFQFHGEIYEKSAEMLNTNPLLMDLNPPPRNPGSAPVMVKDMCTKYWSFAFWNGVVMDNWQSQHYISC